MQFSDFLEVSTTLRFRSSLSLSVLKVTRQTDWWTEIDDDALVTPLLQHISKLFYQIYLFVQHITDILQVFTFTLSILQGTHWRRRFGFVQRYCKIFWNTLLRGNYLVHRLNMSYFISYFFQSILFWQVLVFFYFFWSFLTCYSLLWVS